MSVTSLHNYQFIDESIEQALIEIAKLNNTQLIMQSGEYSQQYVTLTCLCSLTEVLDKLFKDTHFQYRLSKNGSLLVYVQAKTSKQSQAINKESYERILVTGFTHKAKSILRSSSAVTAYNKSTFIDQGQPNSADMLKHVPGFWVEDSGGEANNNVAPRGLRGGEGYRFISVMEDGLPISYDGIWVDFFQRQDIMTSSVETIRGGNSGILSVNGPAAVVNFISEDGTTSQDNEIVLKQGVDHKSTRVDLRIVEKISDSWHIAFGGFYRKSDGIREPGFTADNGGQLKIVSNYQKKDTSISVIAKVLNDKTTFYSPIVFTGEKSPKAVKHLSATHGTMLSRYFSKLTFTPPIEQSNVIEDYDIRDGQQTNMTSLGIFGHHDVNENWRFSYKVRYSDMQNDMLAMINLDNNTIFTANEYLSSPEVLGFLNQNKAVGATEAILKSVNDNFQVQSDSTKLFSIAYPLYSNYQQYQWFSNGNMSFDYDVLSGSLGHYFARSKYTSLPFDKWLGQYLIDVKHQPQRFDIIGLNKVGDEVAKMTEEGQLSSLGPAYIDGKGFVESHSLYGQLSANVLDMLTFDVGIRLENLLLESTASTDKLYFEEHSLPIRYISNYQFSRKKKFKESAWNIGVNYTPNEHIALFANTADAFEMPRVTSFGNAIGWSDYVDNVPDTLSFEQPVRLTFSELGFRYDQNNSLITAILFKTKFDPLLVNVYRGKSASETVFMNTETIGVELEFFHQLNKILTVKGTSVWQRARFSNISQRFEESIYNHNQITRTPELQLRLETVFDIENINMAIRYHYIGDRYSDIANKRKLPKFQYVDMNIKWQISPQFAVNLVGNNIFNSYGLTEGNPRTNHELTSSTYYYARPIFGRSFSLSFQYHF
ncbi:TonB-dependent receptor [Thalassotalea sediminis]|uniref:TonB-dependent receptor n=1 Tax=Thalassotalea sediminis TaxID=1759089 RepID=UPI002572C74E|nr:TonB-dependent receptor [Thalassotalea sediminis]